MWWGHGDAGQSDAIPRLFAGAVLADISMVIMIAAMGLIYARMFHMEITNYLPFLTVGLVIWNFVSTVIIEGCHTSYRRRTTLRRCACRSRSTLGGTSAAT